MKPDHLVKVLAERGVASRRGSEKLVHDGLVTVDGAVAQDPGAVVDPRAQRILIDGKPLPPPPKPLYLVLHKPAGVLTSRNDPEGRKTVYDLLPELEAGAEAVGRLDYGSEGVLLFTNDGELAYRLTHPSHGVPKTYLAKVSGTPDERKLARLRHGMTLDDGPTGPSHVVVLRTTGPSTWLMVTIREGRNRIVRRLMDQIGHKVLKLKRIAFGGIALRGLLPGQARPLRPNEVAYLRRLVADGRAERSLEPSWSVRAAAAEALHEPLPERHRERAVSRDEEGRPYRKKGWARPKVAKGRGGPRER
jgi:pseudouridine synthase